MNRKSRAIPKQASILIMAACFIFALLPVAVLAETESPPTIEGSGPCAMELSANGGLGTMGGEPEDITGEFADPNFLAAVRGALEKAENVSIYADDFIGRTVLNLAGMGIQNLAGIKYFIDLEELVCSYNQLTELDVSSLRELIYLDCEGNQLTILNVSGLNKLEHLVCRDNQLSSLRVRNLASITSLDCTNNQITGLDVSGSSNLKWLFCSNNQLSSIEVNGLNNLEGLYCSHNQLSFLDVSNLKSLRGLYCSYNQLGKLLASDLTSLETLICSNNKLETLNLSGAASATTLDFRYNYFSGKEKITLDGNKEVDNDDFIPQFDKDYELTVAGVTVNAHNANAIIDPGIRGTVSYDKVSKTLTLSNVKIAVSDDDWEYGIYSRENIKIQLIGDNIIGTELTDATYGYNTRIGIYAPGQDVNIAGRGNLTIFDYEAGVSGKNIAINANGKIVIKEEVYDSNYCCLRADGGTLTINSGDLALYSVRDYNFVGLQSQGAYCLYGDHIVINGGTITAWSEGERAFFKAPEYGTDFSYVIKAGNNPSAARATANPTYFESYIRIEAPPTKRSSNDTAPAPTSISGDTLQSHADAGSDLVVPLTGGIATLDNAALASILDQSAEGADLKLELKQIPASELTDAQKESVKEGDLVLDINLLMGTRNITEFDGTLTIDMPYDGELPVGVWYLNDRGELERIEASYKDGVVSFVLHHLSIYIVGLDEAAKEAQRNPFADVLQSDWFYSSVLYAYENGLMKGTGSSSFTPYGATTRGMIVTILHRLEGEPAAESSPYTDVAADQYYSSAVAWASLNEIVSGYGNDTFGPEDAVTREQMAVILKNYAEYKGYDLSGTADLSGYSDSSSISPWAADAMAWANAAGLIQGDGIRLAPAGNTERCQAAAILQRFIEKFQLLSSNDR
ncbi:MAG TPA: hypothetical protein GX688_06850 [Clostridiales bacterium]|nr:hypothetical protein [Clostridiales bacterium]